MAESIPTIPLPSRRAYLGLRALVRLGKESIKQLAAKQTSQPLTLELYPRIERLAAELNCDKDTLETAIIHAIIPLNGVRRSLQLPTETFVKAISQTVSEEATDDWKKENLRGWNDLIEELQPFFEPDNFFAQTSKAFELLSQRPAVFQHVKILTELRPVFDEATEKTLAVIQSNTLILRFWDGGDMKAVHVTLDQDDLDALIEEVEHAKEKSRVSQREAISAGTNFLVYGDAGS
jgi:hypothetical protein